MQKPLQNASSDTDDQATLAATPTQSKETTVRKRMGPRMYTYMQPRVYIYAADPTLPPSLWTSGTQVKIHLILTGTHLLAMVCTQLVAMRLATQSELARHDVMMITDTASP